jgi:outer membrane receptor protein involved in Fe transport
MEKQLRSTRAISLLCFCISFQAFGQSTVSGILVERESKPLLFANVLLLQAKDSSLIKGTVTDNTGKYYFENIARGSYIIKAYMIGYTPAFSTITLENATYLVAPIEMMEDVKTLDEVSVVAQKPLYEQQIDRLVINVKSSITAAGATALEVLERSPGITLDRQNGSLSMNGKGGVQVMVNGKLSRLPMYAIIQMLAGMQACNIEKIELITNPSAKYDAEGNAGMINIILKKNTEDGTNGSLMAHVGYGWYGKTGASLNLNHRRNKLNLFGDYSLAYQHNWYVLGNNRKVMDGDMATQTNSSSNSPHINTSHTSRIGFDYSLSPKTTIGALISGFSNKQDIDARNTIHIQHGQDLPTLINQHTLETNHWRHIMGNLNGRHTFNEKHAVSLDLDYLLYYNRSPAAYLIGYQFLETAANAQENIRINKTTPIRMGVAKADYTFTIAAKAKLETGIKGSFSGLDNEVVVDRLQQENWTSDTTFSQKIDMTENILAAYSNFHLQINPKTSLQAGLRWEHTFTNINSPVQNNLVLRKYHNLFPSLFLSRELTKNHSVQFSYSRRITRPTFNNLVPFVSFKDPYSFWSGNSMLKPTITDAMQASYSLKKKYIVSLQASFDRNAINWLVRLDPETNKQNVYIANVDRTNTYSLNLNIPLVITSWWQMQNNLSMIWQRNNTLYEGSRLQLNGRYGRINNTHNIQLPSNFTLEVSAYYQTKALFGVFRQRSQGSINIGIQKKLPKEWGTINLSISDIFWTNRFIIKLAYPSVNLDQTFYNYHEPHVIRLTYSINFGNKNMKAFTRRSTGSEEERHRVGN